MGILQKPTILKKISDIETDLGDMANQISGISASPKGVFSTLTALQADATANTTDGKKNIYVVLGSNGVQEVDTLAITGVPTASGNLSVTLNGVTTNIAVTIGVAEVASLTVTAPCSSSGDATVTLNGVGTNVALDSGTDTTTDLVATKIRNATYTGWTTGGTGSTVTFTATDVGVKTDASYSAGTTGATGTMTTTTQGVDADTTTTVATKIRGTSFTGWTTGGTGTSVTFTKNTIGTNTPAVFSAGTTGVTATLTITTSGVASSTSDWYYWNGTQWTDGGVYQNVGVANNSISFVETDFLYKENYFDVNNVTITEGIRLNGNKSTVSDATYFTTDYFRVNPNILTYYFNCVRIEFYDSNKNSILYKSDGGSLIENTSTLSSKPYFCRITDFSISQNKAMVKSLLYVSETSGFKKSECSIKNLKPISGFTTKNIYITGGTPSWWGSAPSGGTLTQELNGVLFTVNNTSGNQVAFAISGGRAMPDSVWTLDKQVYFVLDYEVVSGLSSDLTITADGSLNEIMDSDNFTCTEGLNVIPAKAFAKDVRCTGYIKANANVSFRIKKIAFIYEQDDGLTLTTENVTNYVSSLSNQADLYKNGSFSVNYPIFHTKNKELTNKVWLRYGDSLSGLNWGSRIVSKLNMTLIPGGIGGSTASKVEDRTDEGSASTRIAALPGSVDIITVMFGTNDWSRNINIGTLPSIGIRADYTWDTTKYGEAMCSIVAQLQAKYPLARIILMSPPFRPSNTNPADPLSGVFMEAVQTYTLFDYGDMVKQVARRFGCGYIDTIQEMGINIYNVTNFFQNPDWVHFYNLGRDRLEKVVYRKMLEYGDLIY